MDKKAVSSSGFSCSVCTLCRPLRCKALKSRLWQKDAPCQRLYLYSDLLLGCAFTVCRGNDRPTAIRSAQAHLFCAAVNEIRLCSPDELTVLEVLAALIHSQQLCNGHAAHLADDIYIQPAVVGLCFRRCTETAAIGAAIADGTHLQSISSVSPSMVYSTLRPICPHSCSTMEST